MTLTRRGILVAYAGTLFPPHVARAQQASITLAAYAGIFQDNDEPVDWLEVAKFRESVTEQWRRRVLTRR